MPKPIITDHEILQAALIGLQHSLAVVDERISELRRMGVRSGASQQPAPAATKRGLSAGARRRIAAAQKKRWAAFRKSHKK